MLLSMVVLAGIVLADRRAHHLVLAAGIPALLLQTVFNVGVGLLVARLGSQVNDFSQLLPFLMRTWLYVSGVLFSIQTLDIRTHRWLVVGCLSSTRPRCTSPWSAMRCCSRQRLSAPGSKPYNAALCQACGTPWATSSGAPVKYQYDSAYCHYVRQPRPLLVLRHRLGGGRRWWSASSSSGERRRGMAVAEPMVVVDDLHIVYKVYGAGGDRGTAATVAAAHARPQDPRLYPRGARDPRHVVRRLPRRRRRRHRPERLGQVHPAAGDRRPASAGAGQCLHHRRGVAARRQRSAARRSHRRAQRRARLPGHGHDQAGDQGEVSRASWTSPASATSSTCR